MADTAPTPADWTSRISRSPALLRLLGILRWAFTETPLLGVIAATILGLYRIGEKSIWLDEAFSIQVTQQPTLDMLGYLARFEIDKSPYYIALQPWTALGTGEAVVRSLSVVFGVLAVVATFAVAKRFGAGWLAALILAVHPSFVEFEQETRGYTMLIFWSALSTLAFVRLTERFTLPRAAAYVVLAALIIYVHPLGALIVVAHGLATLLWVAPELRRRVLATFVPVALLWLPMLVFAFVWRAKISWIAPLTADSVASDLMTAAGGPLVGGALLVLVVAAARRDLPSVWLVAPIIGTLLISVVVEPALQAKYVLGTLPAAAIIASRNKAAPVAVLLILSLYGTWTWYETGRKDDWRDGAALVASLAQPGDGVVFGSPNMRLPFGYYAFGTGDPLYPARPWSERYLPYGADDQQSDVGGINSHNRIWLVEGHGRYLPPEVQSALAPFRVVLEHDYGGSGPFIQLLVR
jgi:mannosyltransferase